jgi:hypothetical protein
MKLESPRVTCGESWSGDCGKAGPAERLRVSLPHRSSWAAVSAAPSGFTSALHLSHHLLTEIMASEQPLTFRWGVIATGDIARKVITDFLVDPKTRNVHDVVHKIVAVGSRSVDKARHPYSVSAQRLMSSVIGRPSSSSTRLSRTRTAARMARTRKCTRTLYVVSTWGYLLTKTLG